jgi:hypothetical protein
VRKWKWLAAVIGLAVLVAVGVVVVWPPLLTLERADRIKRNMTRAEVVAVLGQPDRAETFRWPNGTPGVEVWRGEAGDFKVEFSAPGRVVGSGWWETRPRNQSILARAVAWAERLWRKWFP